MYELLKIKEQLECAGYKDANSLFELRMLIMHTATWLASRHISNLKRGKDVAVSELLLKVFKNLKDYYRFLENTKDKHAIRYEQIKEQTLADINELSTKLEGQPAKILYLSPEEALSPFRVAR